MFSHWRNIKLQWAVAAVAAMAALQSCDALREDLPECEVGLRLRFVYDYTMDGGNAFPAQVDCLTLYVYDGEGDYVATVAESRPELLSDEAWRMTLPLPAGRYRLVAYGGIGCADASFAPVSEPGPGSRRDDLAVALTDEPSSMLHHLYYGSLNVTVPDQTTSYSEATLRMMKDTNDLRILLQHIDGTPVDDRDFTFSITDSNTLMDCDNQLLDAPATTYTPWATGQVAAAVDAEGNPTGIMAYAEMTVARLAIADAAGRERQGPQLLIATTDGRTVIDTPLLGYLRLFKGEREREMGLQEYLDRESRWTIVFFLGEGNKWITTQIKINDWIIRLNDISITD